MALKALLCAASLAAFAFASYAHTAASTALPLAPSDDAARRNAFGIFNAIHSAMRQWGSSLNHNGMSLFMATVPQGQLFYHGGMETSRPDGLEWLAFELEHAQMFGTSRSDRRSGPPEGDRPEAAELGAWDWHVWDRQQAAHLQKRSFDATQTPLGIDTDTDTDTEPGDGKYGRGGRPDFWTPGRGYFHTYRATRPLNLLYIDGMAAGKVPFGCLDTQDLLLLDGDPDTGNDTFRSGPARELERAQGLCDLAAAWAWDGGQIDGFVRAEAGFEIIYCDFGVGGGLDLASVQASPFTNETGGLPLFSQYEFLRGVAQRYHGHPAGRIHVDWSSMVSAYFYDVNVMNPDAARPELPRLAKVTRDERRSIRARLRDVVAARHGQTTVVDWQGIVDMVVTRFAGRFSQMANDTSTPIAETAQQVLPPLMFPYMNHTDKTETDDERVDRCTQHYLSGALATEQTWTPEDHSIFVAVTEVTRTICTALFDMRNVLYDAAANDAADDRDARIRAILNLLMDTLQWTTWRECGPCTKPDELCLIAMFPWGSPDDHFNPRCKNAEEAKLSMRNNYWMMGRH